MMLERYAEMVGALLTVLGPLLGVPLTVITFYLRGLKEQLKGTQAELVKRMEVLEQAAAELRRDWRMAERDFATKEEWLREVLQVRRQMEGLSVETLQLKLRLDLLSGSEERAAARPSLKSMDTLEGEECDVERTQRAGHQTGAK